MHNVVTYACDVGSTRQGNFGWARAVERAGRLEICGGVSIDKCISAIEEDIAGKPCVTLGMESPMFMPIPHQSTDLGRGRAGDGDRSLFAPAGGYVATLGLHQFAFMLKAIRQDHIGLTFDAPGWCSRPDSQAILFWEAFVSGTAHAEDHKRDAATAASAFMHRCRQGRMRSDVTVCEPSETLSLAGCALLWAGWSQDLRLLKRPLFTVKPKAPYSGPVEEA